MISVFALMRVVGALPAGRLVDRFGEPGVMTAGIAAIAVSSVLAGFSKSFAELLILRGGAAFGLAAAVLSGAALLGLISSESRPGGWATSPAVPAASGQDPRVR